MNTSSRTTYFREWRNRNKDRIRGSRKQYNAKYHMENREDINERHKQWRKDNPSLVKATYERRNKRMKDAKNDLKKNGCSSCGYKRCIAALVFHHSDPSVKAHSFAGAIFPQRLICEAGKCNVLCHNCHNELHAKDKGQSYRGPVIAIKTELKSTGCVVCGYKGSDRALTFHHIDPFTKKHGFDGYVGLNRFRKEIKKCIVLCHNCHSEVHAGIISIPKPNGIGV